MMEVADPDAVHAVRNFIKKELAVQLKDDLLAAVSGTSQVATVSVPKSLAFGLFKFMPLVLPPSSIYP